ncbi:MAG: heme-binding domain-containing protein [Syntrophotaleaceae bacterium]
MEPAWDKPQTPGAVLPRLRRLPQSRNQMALVQRVAPLSWLVQHDVSEGREHFNVSLWGMQDGNNGDEAAEELREGGMPPWFYLIPHPEGQAVLEKKALVELVADLRRRRTGLSGGSRWLPLRSHADG